MSSKPWKAGTSRHVIDVVRHATGVEHEIVVPPRRLGGLTDERAIGRLEEAGGRVHVLAMARAPWNPRNAVALTRLARLLRQRRPDVVHGHSSIGGLLARVAAVGLDAPRLYTPNGITNVRAGIAVERVLRRVTDRFVAVSASEGEAAVQLRIASGEQVVVIPNGIEMDAPPPIDLRARLGVDAGTPLVGTIARLVPQKAPLDFVAACAVVASAVPDARFVLIGGGDMEAEVDAAVVQTGLSERFTRVPVLPGAAGALADLDVFALSSQFEGGPYAPLEAMRAGTAVVLTDVVGSRDAVVDGVSGRLVPFGAPARLGEAVVDLLVHPDRRARLAAAGQARVSAEFDVRQMGAKLAELYRSLAT